MDDIKQGVRTKCAYENQEVNYTCENPIWKKDGKYCIYHSKLENKGAEFKRALLRFEAQDTEETEHRVGKQIGQIDELNLEP